MLVGPTGLAAPYPTQKTVDKGNRVAQASHPHELSAAPVTGVGAILRRFFCCSSGSDSLTPPVSRLPRELLPACDVLALANDIGVIGGVVSGSVPVEFVAVTPGTVPIVGVGELPTSPALCACDACVATDDTEFDRDLVGLDPGALATGDAKDVVADEVILNNDGGAGPVGVGTGDAWAELLIPTVSEGG